MTTPKVMASASAYVRSGRTNPADDRSGRAQTSDLRRTRWRPVSPIGGVFPRYGRSCSQHLTMIAEICPGTQVVEGGQDR
jgi:hypothetical protein